MDELVRDDMKSSWELNKEKWFADETVEQSKKPGLLKREYGCSRGRFLGLSSKCYHISDGTKSKRSNKGFIYYIYVLSKKINSGTPLFINLAEKDFEMALLQGQTIKKSFNQISFDKRYSTACTKKVTKRALNSIYLKMTVSDDLITISPLKSNGQYV